MLERLPARAGAVLIGHIFRSVLAPNGWTPVLVGSPGSYKTGVAALAMHFLGEAWDRRKPAVSLSGNGDTFNSIRWKLHQARDAVLFGDDLAPTKDLTAAQKIVDEARGVLVRADIFKDFAGLTRCGKIVGVVAAAPGWNLNVGDVDDSGGSLVEPIAAWLVTSEGHLYPVGGTNDPYLETTPNQPTGILPPKGLHEDVP